MLIAFVAYEREKRGQGGYIHERIPEFCHCSLLNDALEVDQDCNEHTLAVNSATSFKILVLVCKEEDQIVSIEVDYVCSLPESMNKVDMGVIIMWQGFDNNITMVFLHMSGFVVMQ